MKSGKGRMLSKDISISDKFANLSKESQVLFLLLIPHFNPHGKMVGDPYYIKGLVVPKIKWMTLKQIEKCLYEISEGTNIKWFEFNGIMYLQSLSWKQHQQLRDDKMGNDELPAYQVRDKSHTSPVLVPDYSRTTPGLLPSEVEEEVEEEVRVREREREKEKTKKEKEKDAAFAIAPARVVDEWEVMFSEFWKLYPRKVGKPKAKIAFRRIKPTRDLLETILSSIRTQSQSDQWQKDGGVFIPHPTTWLHREGWNDATPTPTSQSASEAILRSLKGDGSLVIGGLEPKKIQ